jgi:hypothetical protein
VKHLFRAHLLASPRYRSAESGAPSSRPRLPLLRLAGALLLPVAVLAQGGPLYINEIIADNQSRPPTDVGGAFVDMLELYNDSDTEIVLGTASDATSYYLSDRLEFLPTAWRFPAGRATIPAKGFLVVFCDPDLNEADCELHTSFQIDAAGNEPITLWGPQRPDGTRPVVDQVWPPPLRADVSFGRSPDGAGPAPVPIDQVLDVFKFFPPPSPAAPGNAGSTFGFCAPTSSPPRPCFGGVRRICLGAPNGPPGIIEPRVDLISHSTNRPQVGEPVQLTVQVRDEKLPLPGNITSVRVYYRVNGGSEETAPLTYDGTLHNGGVLDALGNPSGTPNEYWTHWSGEIPGQAAGARVEFYFRVTDADGLSGTGPRNLCPEGVGPCDREFGPEENGCMRDTADVTCDGAIAGQRFVSCNKPLTYVVGYQPTSTMAHLVINEVVPLQNGLLEDITEGPCRPGQCADASPNCCRFTDDFIELLNTHESETIDLSNVWLSDRAFNPRRWRFPPGSKIRPREYLIVWLDNDGSKCPYPDLRPLPCYYECPDPNDPVNQEYHATFALAFANEEIHAFEGYASDPKSGVIDSFGWIHGVAFSFTAEQVNMSLSLIPDGDRDGCWIISESPTPRAPNTGSCEGEEPRFKRGDANSDCIVDITDAIYVLNWLFIGGATPVCQDAADADDNGRIELTDAVRILGFLFTGGADPPPPGPRAAGVDPTPDNLPRCEAPLCP